MTCPYTRPGVPHSPHMWGRDGNTCPGEPPPDYTALSAVAYGLMAVGLAVFVICTIVLGAL
jgi:hypothetical protein